MKTIKRAAARQQILDAANADRPINLANFSHRTIQQAVFKVRQFRRVPEDVLVAAGYRAKGQR